MSCENALASEVGETLRLGYVEPGRVSWLRLEVPGAGFLRIEASAGAPGRPALGLWGRSCAGRSPSPVVERGAGHLTAWVQEAGPLLLRVAAEDPAERLDRLKLVSLFVPDPPAKGGEDEDEIEADGGGHHAPVPLPYALPLGATVPAKGGEDEDEIEADGGGYLSPLPIPTGSSVAGALPAKGGEDEDEIEADGGGLRALPLVPWGELCSVADDHGNTFACASRLERGVVHGEISNAFGDDVDLFRFRLEGRSGALWRVSLEVRSDFDLALSLFDGQGRRLESDSGGPSRLVRALTSGEYFVRVEGRSGGDGEYGLRLERSVW